MSPEQVESSKESGDQGVTKSCDETSDPTNPTTLGVNVAQRATGTARTNAVASAPQFGCGKCVARWGGQSTSHCSGCHRTFSSLSAFDKHRTGSHPEEKRACLDPNAAGLALLGRRYECWGFEGDGNDFWNEAS